MKTRLRASLGAFALALIAAAPAAAQSGRPLDERLDSIAGSGVVENRAAGIVAAVVRRGDTLLIEPYGRADVEWDVPMAVDAMFETGSMAKQFTAAAILQLRDAGKLSLDDDMTRWLPDFDTRGNRVPLRRLLDHTSGIVGLTEIPEFDHLVTNWRLPRDSAYALINRQPFQFPAGELQIYNNSGFFLAALIVEKASGMTYEDYIEQKLFAPLGMTRSMYCDSREIVPRRAHGYLIRDGQIRRAPMNVHTWPFGAGSICSTAGDLLTWMRALHGGKVLSPESYQEMITPSKLNDGTPIRYGLGLQVDRDIRGRTYIGHGGAIPGFAGEAGWYPAEQLAVVVLFNTISNLNPEGIARELADEVVPGERPAMARFTGNAAPLVGRYRGLGRGDDMTVVVTDTPTGIAFSINGSTPRPLPWADGWTFRRGPTGILTFRRSGDSGPATELRYSTPGAHLILERQDSGRAR